MDPWSQERKKTILMQSFGGTNKEFYGIFESGLLSGTKCLNLALTPTNILILFEALCKISCFQE